MEKKELNDKEKSPTGRNRKPKLKQKEKENSENRIEVMPDKEEFIIDISPKKNVNEQHVSVQRNSEFNLDEIISECYTYSEEEKSEMILKPNEYKKENENKNIKRSPKNVSLTLKIKINL